MESLYARSEESFAKSLISSGPLDRLVLALARVTRTVLASPSIPTTLRPQLLVRALQLLRSIEHEENLLDLAFARCIPHPRCGERVVPLGELWALPREQEWLCDRCGRPLYYIQNERS